MSWLKALWSRIFSEDREKCTHIFQTICIEAGVSRKDLKNGKVLELFADWYDGPCDRKSIEDSITQFKKENAVANAKLVGKI